MERREEPHMGREEPHIEPHAEPHAEPDTGPHVEPDMELDMHAFGLLRLFCTCGHK